jgi:hypothetical protein
MQKTSVGPPCYEPFHAMGGGGEAARRPVAHFIFHGKRLLFCPASPLVTAGLGWTRSPRVILDASALLFDRETGSAG